MNITLREAREYVATRYGVRVSRQTIHNWFVKGIAGNHLAVVRAPAIAGPGFRLETTKDAVDDFIAGVSPLMLEKSRNK